MGQKNYTAIEIDMLLDIVAEIEPLGANMWAEVHERYNQWAMAQSYPMRDADMLKQKFDRLANEKKPTGNPRCPAPVRKAKQVARNILSLAQAAALGGILDDDHDSDSTIYLIGASSANARDRLGARPGRRAPGAMGVRSGNRRAQEEATLVECVSHVTQKFSMMADAVASRYVPSIEELVRIEVQSALAPSNE